MAKERYIDTKFWDDNYIIKLGPVEKLIFIYFLTNPLTNICGIYEVSLKRMAFDTGIKEDIILTILKRFEKANKIRYENGYIAIKSFIRHQKENPKIRAGISYELKTKPKSLINFVETLDYILTEKKKRKTVSKTLRKKIFEKYGYRCFFCGRTDNLEIDHIIPVNQGGNSKEDNLRVLCQSCNGRRNAGLKWSKEENGWVINSQPIGYLEMGRLSHLNSNSNINTNTNDTPLNSIKFKKDNIEYKLSLYLFKKMKENNLEAKEPNFQLWAKEIDLMLRIDKRKPEIIKQVIKWCQEDNFWFKNILSTGKLRKQFDRLLLNMKSDSGGTKNYAKSGGTKKYTERDYTEDEIEQIEKRKNM